MQYACNGWHNFVGSRSKGDIYCHWEQQYGSYRTNVYIKLSELGTGKLGLTWNCNVNYYCSADKSQSMDVWYSEIWYDVSNVDILSQNQRRFLFGHELGHTLGLWHHTGDYLMNASVRSSPTLPTFTDYGRYPPCSDASSLYGPTCVFNLRP